MILNACNGAWKQQLAALCDTDLCRDGSTLQALCIGLNNCNAQALSACC